MDRRPELSPDGRSTCTSLPKGMLLIVALVSGHGAWAAEAAAGDDGAGSMSRTGNFLDRWFATSDDSKEEQPHWMTPLVTVTPRLEQEFRYDQSWQNRPKGVNLTNYGGGKGLELIPTENTEVIIGVPAYQTRETPRRSVHGWADETLLLKYRFLTGNEENGNYIVTAFLGVSVPTGNAVFTQHDEVITPTIAVGKGWGTRTYGVDIQTTLGAGIPTGDKRTLGVPIVWNAALQAHVLEKLWPEIEVSYTYFDRGPNDGKTQVALTAGVILGRFEITPHVRFIAGGGYQKPVSAFYTFNHTWLATARITF